MKKNIRYLTALFIIVFIVPCSAQDESATSVGKLNLVWSACDSKTVTDIAVDSAGNSYTTGYNSSNQYFITKTNANGVVEWEQYGPTASADSLWKGIVINT